MSISIYVYLYFCPLSMSICERKVTWLLSNQGEKSIHFFHKGSFKKKGIKVWYSKAQVNKTMQMRKPSLARPSMAASGDHMGVSKNRGP